MLAAAAVGELGHSSPRAPWRTVGNKKKNLQHLSMEETQEMAFSPGPDLKVSSSGRNYLPWSLYFVRIGLTETLVFTSPLDTSR